MATGGERERGREGERERESGLPGPGFTAGLAFWLAGCSVGPLRGGPGSPLSPPPLSISTREGGLKPASRVADSAVWRARCRRGPAGAAPRHRLSQSRGRILRHHPDPTADPRVVTAHAAQTRVVAGRATCRSARPWTLGRARGVPTHSRRLCMLLVRGCSLSPCTVRCDGMRLPVAGSPPPWVLRLVIFPYPDLPLLRRRLLRRLTPRLSIMGISRIQMGG